MKKRLGIAILIVMLLSGAAWAQSSGDRLIRPFMEAEAGFLKVLAHSYQSGSSGTDFNFVTSGGQEILFPVSRYTVGVRIGERHLFSALYQPLNLETTVQFRDDVVIDGVTFNSGSAMDLKYGFSFWRFSYGYDLVPGETFDVRVGGALQLRNASIVFARSDGTQTVVSQNLGPVPAIFTSLRWTADSGTVLGFDATGIYASSAFFNGADFNFEGSLLDSSVRVEFPVSDRVSAYVSLRVLGGTARGTSGYADRYWTQSMEDYTNNRLATVSLTSGVKIR